MDNEMNRYCLGHFLLSVDQRFASLFNETTARFDLVNFERLDVSTETAFNQFVLARAQELTEADRERDPILMEIPNGRLYEVRETSRGGTSYGFVFRDNVGFEVQSTFSDRLADQFRANAVDVLSRLRPLNSALNNNAIFCFSSGYILGPTAAPDRSKVYEAIFESQDGLRLKVTSEWLAKPEISFDFDTSLPWASARTVGGTLGVEARLNSGETVGGGGLTVLPPTGGQRYYEGTQGSAPGLRLTIHLWIADEGQASAIDAQALNQIWETLLSSAAPLPALATN